MLGIENTTEKQEIYPGGVLDIPMPSSATRPQWRDALRRKAFPRVHAFAPDMIFISAGFDAHEKEELTREYGRLIEFDYAWITREIQALANLHCEGRVISVLEGGYTTRGGVLSPLAQSVGFHLAELRSRAHPKYRPLGAEDFDRLEREDKAMEERRTRSNEEKKKEHVQRMKRVKHELGPVQSDLVDLQNESEEGSEDDPEEEESMEEKDKDAAAA